MVQIAIDSAAQKAIDSAAILTMPYPDNDKVEWVVKPLTSVKRRSGLVVFSREVYATQASLEAGDRPFLINSWKMQIRANRQDGEHHRIRRDNLGRMLHASGEHVALEDVEDFLLLPQTIKWQENQGLLLPPWMFPNYDGVLEGLDPQWLRERYSLSVQGQIDDNISRYLTGVEVRKLEGDHRGTTLDLQIAASADDAQEDDQDTGFNSTSTTIFLSSNIVDTSRGNGGLRFTGVTIKGTTIDVAYLSVFFFSTLHDSPSDDILGEDVDNAANFTDTADVTSRTRTTASVSWEATDLGTSEVNSPSIVVPVQELADRGSFGDGAAVFFIDGKESPSAFTFIDSYDGGSSSAAKLHIEYTTAGSSIAVLRRRREGV